MRYSNDLSTFRLVFENSIDLILIIESLSGKLLDVNIMACKHLGYKRAELTAMKASDVFPSVLCEKIEHSSQYKEGESLYVKSFNSIKGYEELYEYNISPTILEGKQYILLVGRPACKQLLKLEEIQHLDPDLQLDEYSYRTIVEMQSELICRFLPDMTLTFVNDAYCRYFGKERNELLGTKLSFHLPKQEEVKMRDNLAKMSFENSQVSYEIKAVDKDDCLRYLRWTDRAIFDRKGNILAYQSVGSDISDLKKIEEELRQAGRRLETKVQARTAELTRLNEELHAKIREKTIIEKALRKSDHFLRSILENMPIMMDALDEDGNIVLWNKECERVSGYSSSEILNNPRALGMLYPAERTNCRILCQCPEEVEEIRDWEWSLKCKDGSEKKLAWFNVSKQLPVAGWKIWGMGVDITKRKEVEKVLEESERKYRTLFDTMNEGLIICELLNNDIGQTCNYRILDVNHAAEEFCGLNRENLIGRTAVELRQICYDRIWLGECCENIINRRTSHFQYYNQNSDRYFEVSIFPTTDKQFAQLFVDISETKKMETEIQGQLDFLQTLIDSVPNSIFYKDMQGQYLGCNKAFEELVGVSRDELTGCSVNDFVLSYTVKSMLKLDDKLLKSEGKLSCEERLPYYDGSFKDLIINKATFSNVFGKLDGIVTVCTDITERRQWERDMARLEKLYLIGEMAAGIAHEVRNPMTTVRGFLQMFKDSGDYNEFKLYVDLMIEELDRANYIITEYLSLAKDRTVDLEKQDLNQIIMGIYLLLETEAKKSNKYIELSLADIPELLLDKQQIRQLILNLASNGFEAMDKGGKLRIITYLTGDEVVLAVEDEGNGISPAIMEKLGTPFFTTKEKGTGMGLAVCYSIAERHQAVIDVSTGVGGTSFEVRFKLTSCKHSIVC